MEIKVMKRLDDISESNSIIGWSDSTIAQSETSDCFVRAIAAATDSPYDVAHRYVAEVFKRKPKQGTLNVPRKLKEQTEVLGKKIVELGEPCKTFPNSPYRMVTRYNNRGVIVERQMTLQTFVKQNPKGSYILIVAKHAFALKDGKVVGGNNKDARELRKRVHCAYMIQD
jgi:hypothetical protein